MCFTGQLARLDDGVPTERAQAEELARGAGLIVKTGVSKRLDVLACADPHSQSDRARRARDCGLRSMADDAFWRALGV